MCNDFRFFTPLRSVQNDKGRGVAFRMTEDEGVAGCPVELHGIGYLLWTP